MSFSFTAAGTPKEVIAEVGKQAANQSGVPKGFADSINDQLSGLPDGAAVRLVCYGHTGWSDGQSDDISLHATISVRSDQRPVAQIEDRDPEVVRPAA